MADEPLMAAEDDGPFWTHRRRRSAAWVLLFVLVVVLLAVIPPLVSLNRYQKKVASSIAESLGRPVHFDALALHLLPLPGITIQNFVVNEAPDFGAEPTLRAQNVEARLRLGSLWRRRIEVSHISLESPSINLVRRRSDGAWNLQSVLMRASQMRSAPTAQATAGDAPRFPYIEATDARINVKSDADKLPLALKETELALWLPRPTEWHLRLSGRPVRTDTDVSDVGLLKVEAMLGRAADLSAAPIELSANWKPTPLGEAGKLTVGHDLGWRGDAAATATLKGTLGQSKLSLELHLTQVRRADFVPEHTAEVNAHCEAEAGGLLRSLPDLRCAVPTNTDTSMFAAIEGLRKLPDASRGTDTPDGAVKPGVLLVRGSVPDVMDWRHSDLAMSLDDASPGYALAWLRLFSNRIPREMTVGGTLALTASRTALDAAQPEWEMALRCSCDLPEKHAKPRRWLLRMEHASGSEAALQVVASPGDGSERKIPFAAPEETVLGSVTRNGYMLNYPSREVAAYVAGLLPPLGDALPDAAEVAAPLQAQRAWNGPQTWAVATPMHTPARHRR